MAIQNIFVVGSGLMGSGIAQNALTCGYNVFLNDQRQETLERALCRKKLDRETNVKLVEVMWEQFQNLGDYESHVIDTTGCSPEETVDSVKKRIEEGASRLEAGGKERRE